MTGRHHVPEHLIVRESTPEEDARRVAELEVLKAQDAAAARELDETLRNFMATWERVQQSARYR